MALSVHHDKSVLGVDWSKIDTVLLDMDGTLLDLRFDTQFWTKTVPATYAQTQGIDLEAAQAYLNPIHWSGVYLDDSASLKEVQRWIKTSYNLVVAKLPVAQRSLYPPLP